MKRQITKTLYTFLGAVLFVAIWWIAAAVYNKPIVFPTPAETVGELATELCSKLFWRSFAYSILRSLIGFSIACFAAVLCAYAGKICAPVKRILVPLIGVVRSMPTMSIILLLVIWTNSEITPVVVAGLVIFPVLYSGIDAALSAIPRELEETARLYGGSKTYGFLKVYLPMSAPAFMRVAGGAASLTLKLTVAAEVLAQTRDSLGLIMQQTRIYFQTGRLMTITVVVIVASLIIEAVAYTVRRVFEYD